MSWIKEIEKEDAQGELKEIYDDIEQKRGKLSNIMKVHSLNPAAMSSLISSSPMEAGSEVSDIRDLIAPV